MEVEEEVRRLRDAITESVVGLHESKGQRGGARWLKGVKVKSLSYPRVDGDERERNRS